MDLDLLDVIYQSPAGPVRVRDVLYGFGRRVEVWRVDPHHQIVWDRTWPDGEYAPGVKRVSFVQRKEELTHEQFARHWTENHTPLARQHHPGIWNYTQNVVRRSYTPGGGTFDGIAELHFRTRSDSVDRMYDSEEGRAAIWEVDLATGNHRIFASGLRNPVGMAWEPERGALWAAVNERD